MYKKLASAAIGIALLASPLIISAQETTATDNTSLVASLSALIAQLESELKSLLATHASSPVKALSQLSITATTTSSVVPVPLWYLPLSGNTTDISGNNVNVTNSGGIFITDSVRGQVLSLNGTAACITVNAPLPQSFTKAAWVKLNVLNGTTAPGIMESGMRGLSPVSDIFRVATIGLLRPGVINVSGFFHPADDSSIFPTNTWVHVALTYDAPSQFIPSTATVPWSRPVSGPPRPALPLNPSVASEIRAIGGMVRSPKPSFGTARSQPLRSPPSMEDRRE